MPTASDFELAANNFTAAARDLEPIEDALRTLFDAGTVSGGHLTQALTDARDLSISELAAAREDLRSAAMRCWARAAACRQYEADVAAYHQSVRDWEIERLAMPDGVQVLYPDRPTKPHPWIEI